MNIRFAFAKVDLLIVKGFRGDLGDYRVFFAQVSIVPVFMDIMRIDSNVGGLKLEKKRQSKRANVAISQQSAAITITCAHEHAFSI